MGDNNSYGNVMSMPMNSMNNFHHVQLASATPSMATAMDLNHHHQQQQQQLLYQQHQQQQMAQSQHMASMQHQQQSFGMGMPFHPTGAPSQSPPYMGNNYSMNGMYPQMNNMYASPSYGQPHHMQMMNMNMNMNMPANGGLTYDAYGNNSAHGQNAAFNTSAARLPVLPTGATPANYSAALPNQSFQPFYPMPVQMPQSMITTSTISTAALVNGVAVPKRVTGKVKTHLPKVVTSAAESLSCLIEAAHDSDDSSRGHSGKKRKHADDKDFSANKHTKLDANGKPEPRARRATATTDSSDEENAGDEEYEVATSNEEEDSSSASSSPHRASRSYNTPLLKRGELACGSIRTAPGAKSHKFRSIIRCGVIDAKGKQHLNQFLPYFGKEMDVYTAEVDSKQRALVRASTLADKFNCATNKVGMYLARRRTVFDGIYQAIDFAQKPPGKTGLKIGGYFLTLSACHDFEKHFWEHKSRKEHSFPPPPMTENQSDEEFQPDSSVSPTGSKKGQYKVNSVPGRGNFASKKQHSRQSSKQMPQEEESEAEHAEEEEAEEELAEEEEEEAVQQADDKGASTEGSPESQVAVIAAAAATVAGAPVKKSTESASVSSASTPSFVPTKEDPQSANLPVASVKPLPAGFTPTRKTLTSKNPFESTKAEVLQDMLNITPKPDIESDPTSSTTPPRHPSPASSASVTGALALIKQSLEEDAARKRAILGAGTANASPVSLPVLSFLRSTSNSNTTTTTSPSAPSANFRYSAPAMAPLSLAKP